jgi:hypothetical protein
MSERLSINASANYARNETIAATTSPVKFESYAITTGLSYSVSRTMSIWVSYTHSHFVQGLVGRENAFNRDVLMATVRKEWP